MNHHRFVSVPVRSQNPHIIGATTILTIVNKLPPLLTSRILFLYRLLTFRRIDNIMKLNSQHLRLRTTRVRLVVCLAIFLCKGICAFQLSMVASSPFRQYDGSSTSRNQNSLSQRVQPSSSSTSVTSGLISNMAVMALKLRLEGQTHVSCDVTASSSNVLLRGQVGPVTVRGRGWQSRLGLTCRAIDATVDSCQLDMGRILSNQKLVLTVPGKRFIRSRGNIDLAALAHTSLHSISSLKLRDRQWLHSMP